MSSRASQTIARPRFGARTAARPTDERSRSWRLRICISWLVLVAAAGVLANVLPIPSYSRPVGLPRLQAFTDAGEPFGLDSLGRSVLSRCIYGGRVSLAVGVFATLLAALVGGVIGLIAGSRRGVVGSLFDMVSDAVLAFPPLVLLLALSAVLKPSIPTLVTGLAVVFTPTFAKVVRAQTIAASKKEHVLAATALGVAPWRVIRRDVLPDVIPVAISYGFVVAGLAITAEASLSFLNLGVPSPYPSWGGMIYAARTDLGTSPHLAVFPAIFLLMTVYSFASIGEYLRSKTERRHSWA